MLNGLEGLLAGRPADHIRWGLERMERMLESLGRPERGFRSLHVAGTNGKGSAAAFAHAVLEASGLRAGLYTSPHLVDPRERVRATGGVPADLLDRCADRVRPLADGCGATYFEAITAVALLAYAELGVEWAVLETGLGGRLDATNVVRAAAAAIVTVDLDHERFLGETREAIAAEKAGILKDGLPVALGRLSEGARAVVGERATELGCPLRELDGDVEVSEVETSIEGTRFLYVARHTGRRLRLATRLVGAHQAENAAVALLMVQAAPGLAVGDESIRRGVEAAWLPGRFQVERGARGVWVLDIAHNAAAVAALRRTLEAVSPPRPWVFLVGVLRDKPWAAMLARLLGAGDRAVLTVPPSAPEGRRWDPDAAAAAEHGPGRREVAPQFGAAMARARELAGRGTVVVTGSAHTVGDALVRLRRGERPGERPPPSEERSFDAGA